MLQRVNSSDLNEVSELGGAKVSALGEVVAELLHGVEQVARPEAQVRLGTASGLGEALAKLPMELIWLQRVRFTSTLVRCVR